MKTTVFLMALVVLAIALITGASWEQTERARDHERLPQVGRSIDIGGRSLTIDCAGAGSPTVIFETGAPRPGYTWVFIQSQVAPFTRACWYDRAGFGWSDLGPYPRTSAANSRDLHALLHRAGIPPPYLLVAETLAALDARVYTGLYRSEVSGMVLVDGVHPDLLARFPQIRSTGAPLHKFAGFAESLASRLFNSIGLLRLLSGRNHPGPPPSGLTIEEWTTIFRLTSQPQARVALLEELPALDRNLADARAAGDLGSRPLRVISTAPPNQPFSDAGMELQADLVHLSTRGKQVVVRVPHPGPLYYQAPQSIIDAVRDVVADIRAATR